MWGHERRVRRRCYSQDDEEVETHMSMSGCRIDPGVEYMPLRRQKRSLSQKPKGSPMG